VPEQKKRILYQAKAMPEKNEKKVLLSLDFSSPIELRELTGNWEKITI